MEWLFRSFDKGHRKVVYFPELVILNHFSLVTIGDDVGKNLEGISSGLPKFDLPTFEAPSFGVPMLDDVKNEFTSFSTPLDELKVDLPALAPLPELSMPTLEQVLPLLNF